MASVTEPNDPNHPDEPKRPKIDFSNAIGEAGHEVEDLGWQDVPDTGEVIEEKKEHADIQRGLDYPSVQFPSD